MARINAYESQVATPGGTVSAGKENIAHPTYRLDFESIGQGFANLARASAESQESNARAQLAAMEPQAQLDVLNEYQRVSAAWAPGQKPIAEQMGTYIDDYSAKAGQSLTSDFGRNLVRQWSNETKTKYMLAGASAQLGIETDVRVGHYTRGYDATTALAAKQPDALGPELVRLNALVMADELLPLTTRQEIVQKQSRAAAQRVAIVQAENDPATALAIVNRRLGLEDDVPVSGGIGDVTEEIIRIESGGRMFDGSGRVLRGPAIPAPDGSKYHAYGKYQMTEATAAATARELGMPWDAELFHGRSGDKQATEAYHERLGRAHIEANAEMFDGDPVLVAAAHNMGVAAARAWADGRPYQTQSGKWWRPSRPRDPEAMPTETREYVGKLRGSRVAAPAVDTESDAATAFRLLDTDSLLQVRNQAQANLAAQERQRGEQRAIGKAAFEQTLQDIEAASLEGEVVPLPSDGEFAAFLGPVRGEIAKAKLTTYQQMAGGLSRLPNLSNEELQAILVMPEPEGTENRANRQFAHDKLVSRAQQLLTARANDPGQEAMRNPEVRSSLGDYTAAAQAVYEAGRSVTPEQMGAYDAAQSRYIQSSFAVQRKWGIAEPKLPDAVVAGIADGFLARLKTDPEQAAQGMVRLPKKLGSYEALAQVGEKTGDIGWFAMEGVPARTLAAMSGVAALKSEERDAMLPGATTAGDVKDAVGSAFAPLLATLTTSGLGGVGDNATANRYYNGGVQLATQYLISGLASSPKAAAERAYADLYGSRQTVQAGLRIPNDYDPDSVVRGLGLILREFKPAQMYLEPGFVEPGLTLTESRARVLRNVQRNGTWVTSEDGEGAYLMNAGKPVRDAAGKPIKVGYRTAQGVRGSLVNPIDEATMNRQWGLR